MKFVEGKNYKDSNSDTWKVVNRTKKYIYILSNQFSEPTKKKIKKDVLGNEIIEFNCRYPFNILANQ